MPAARLHVLPALLLLTLPLPAQKKTAPPTPQQAEDAVLLADVQAFDLWLKDYKTGAFRLVKNGAVDEAALQQVDERMGKLAKWNVIGAAKMLFEAASVEPVLPGAHASTEVADFHRELQPWRVQALAQKHLRTMTGPGIVDWLIDMLGTRGRGSRPPAPAAAAAVLRVFAGHPSVEAQLELLHACTSLPTELRVKAVDALSQGASLDTVPSLLDLLRDVEPNVRIAASNGLGHALAPLVDETAGKHPDGELLKTRDLVIQRLKELLLREPIWQVRNAAAFALAGLKCKPVVPALIDGLKAELARKKDPWAMDMRLHRLLEGLTGQQVVPGDARLWEEFWKAEGERFTVAPKTAPGKPKPKSNKYQKFFDLEIESDRVLFLVDFSGSMAEAVTLAATGSTLAGKNGLTTTKAQLVVSELKKIVMGLPSGAMLNFVVFSDEARCWREDRGRPALVKLDDAARDDLLGSFLDSLRPQGPTNLYAALDKAIEFAGRGLHDKYYEAGFDTLYVITDGAPSVGEVTDKDEIRRRVRDANRLRKLTIHCITFGDKNDTDFLRPLAEENGGRHIHIE